MTDEQNTAITRQETPNDVLLPEEEQEPPQRDVDYYYDQEPERGGPSGCLYGLLGMMGCLAIPLIALLVVVVMGLNTVDGVIDGIGSIFNPPPPTYTTISSAVVLDRIQDLSQLTTTRYNFSNVVTTERDLPQVLEALYRDRLTMVIAGYVNAGIDLSQLTEDDIRISENVLTIQLPPPTLQDCALNEQASYVVERATGVFASPAPDLDSEARRFAVSQFRDMALEEGILQDVNVQAVSAVDSAVGLILDAAAPENVTAIQVVASDVDADAPVPETCGGQPAPANQTQITATPAPETTPPPETTAENAA
jgi:hypothetical protein